MEKRGLDISSYQKGINFDIVKDNVDFLILRAGFTGWGTGVNYNKDSSFENFYAQSKQRGIPVGAYWYSCANTYEKGKAEAEYMYNNCLAGKQFEYPIYIDVEENRHQMVGKVAVANAIRGFCECLESKGFYVGIYANSNYFNNYIDTASLSMYDKWLAVWTNNKPTFRYGDYGMWQNGDDGRVAGYRVDTDIAYKDYPTIIKNAGLNGYAGGSAPTPSPVPTKDVDTLAKEVINGNWGNGDDRKNRLTQAGYDYNKVQARVNEILGAKNTVRYYTVVAGDTLSGIARKLGIADWHTLYNNNRDVIGNNPNVIYPNQKLRY